MWRSCSPRKAGNQSLVNALTPTRGIIDIAISLSLSLSPNSFYSDLIQIDLFLEKISHIIVMPESKNVIQLPELGFWEKADLPFVHASVVVQALYAAITGLFRGKSSPRKYSHHVTAAAIRGMVGRISIRQKQYVTRSADRQ